MTLRIDPTHLAIVMMTLAILPLDQAWGETPAAILDESGFVSMFDGKTLSGWKVSTPKAADAWSVRNGMIVGEGDHGRSYLIFDKNREIANFEMKFSYRFPGSGNSGVNIRAKVDATGKRNFQAYHVDLGHVGIGPRVLGAWDFHTPGRKEHRCFRGDRLLIDANDRPTIEKVGNALSVNDLHKNDWNAVHVIAQDNRFRFLINGKAASEFVEHLPEAKRLDSGMIQLQLHDPGMVVHFKDLYLKLLD